MHLLRWETGCVAIILVRLSWTTACGMAWCIIASSAPDQPIAASHYGKSWKLSGESDARSSLMRDRAMHCLSITEAHLVVRKNLYISAQGRAKAGTRQLMEVSRRTPHFI